MRSPRCSFARRLASRACGRHGSEAGQAAVELVALLPLVGLLVALLWQALLAGEAVWLSGGAARAAARAVAVGGDPAEAARAVLPARLERGLRVERGGDGDVSLVVQVPSVLGGALASFTTRARFEAQR
ncbi:MAG TPA: hypothetical protein VFV85_03095 [Conexibacter sp.]|nr:hypothetical protein [Conexibacter sp.]